MKRLLFICAFVFLASAAQAQTPVALAPVPKPVFTQNGAPLVGGCLSTFSAGTTTPLASYTDSTGSVANTNPIILDANGSPTNAIYLSAAAYKFQLKTAGGSNCSSGSTVWTADNVSAAAFLNLPNTWTALQAFTAGIVVNTLTVGRLNGIRFVDGTQFTTVQQAINDLPTGATGGGIVYIPPGSYACPSSIPQGVSLVNAFSVGITAPPQIWSKFNGAAFQSFSAGIGSQNMVKFTCAGNFILQDVSQVSILGIVWDMGNAGNFTIKGVAWSNFAMAVVNVPTTLVAVNIVGDTANAFNTVAVRFFWLITEGGSGGVSIGQASGNASTIINIDEMFVLADAQPAGAFTALGFAGQCDTTTVNHISVFTTNAITNYQGIVFNTSSAIADTDADWITIGMYEETMNGTPATSKSIVLNPSFGNTFSTGVLQSNTQFTNTAWAGTTTWTWHRRGNIGGGNANLEQAATFQALIGYDTDGTATKHKQFGVTTATAAGANATATTVYSWTTPFADNNYVPVCSPGGAIVGTPIFQGIVGQTASQITVQVMAATAVASSFGAVMCQAFHNYP